MSGYQTKALGSRHCLALERSARLSMERFAGCLAESRGPVTTKSILISLRRRITCRRVVIPGRESNPMAVYEHR